MVADGLIDTETSSTTHSSFLVWSRPDPLLRRQTSSENLSYYRTEICMKAGPLLIIPQSQQVYRG